MRAPARHTVMNKTKSKRCNAISIAVLSAPWLVLSAGCGGTTGHQDLPSNSNAVADAAAVTTVDAGGEREEDATVDASAAETAFDATIMYADAARLPHFDLDAGAEGGEAGIPAWQRWPACACDSLQLDPALGIPVGVPADGGACSAEEVVWTRRPACDRCYRTLGIEDPTKGHPFPACCDLRDGGNAAAGSAAGTPLFNLCADLYTCILETGCWAAHGPDGVPYGVLGCYCGDTNHDTCAAGNGNGPCMPQFAAAFQVIPGSPDQGLSNALMTYSNLSLTSPGYAGAEVMELFQAMFNSPTPPPLAGQCDWACNPEPPDAAPYTPPQGSVVIDGGSFTKTESLLYLANPSCYACLKDVGCLDDNRGDMNNECEDLAGQTVPASADAGGGQSRQDLCYATLQCILGSPSCLNAFGADFQMNNPCIGPGSDCQTQEQSGLETTDPNLMTTNFNNRSLGAGVANRILNCASALNCPTCFSP